MNDDRGWFTSFEMSHSTALLVQQQKSMKYDTRLLKSGGGGKCVVQWRGYTSQELIAVKKAKKLEDQLLKSQQLKEE